MSQETLQLALPEFANAIAFRVPLMVQGLSAVENEKFGRHLSELAKPGNFARALKYPTAKRVREMCELIGYAYADSLFELAKARRAERERGGK